MNRCLLSLATHDKHYAAGLQRLTESARRSGYTGEILAWPPGSFPEGCPPHPEVPFAFKPFAFREAQKRGLELALWLDSACVVVRGLDPLFGQLAERGYVLFANVGKRVGQWASDAALERLGVSREQAMQMPEVSAGALGLNLASPPGAEFLEQWHAEALAGTAFRGAGPGPLPDYMSLKWNRAGAASADPRVRGHRHDQTVAGVLAARLGLELTAEGLQTYSRSHARIRPRTLILIDRSVAGYRGRVPRLERILAEAQGSQWAYLLRRLKLNHL